MRRGNGQSGACSVTQTDRNPRGAGRIGSHPLKTAEGGAASFGIALGKIKSEGGLAAPLEPKDGSNGPPGAAFEGEFPLASDSL